MLVATDIRCLEFGHLTQRCLSELIDNSRPKTYQILLAHFFIAVTRCGILSDLRVPVSDRVHAVVYK